MLMCTWISRRTTLAATLGSGSSAPRGAPLSRRRASLWRRARARQRSKDSALPVGPSIR
jgi:hypothetical protein